MLRILEETAAARSPLLAKRGCEPKASVSRFTARRREESLVKSCCAAPSWQAPGPDVNGVQWSALKLRQAERVLVQDETPSTA